MKKSRFIYHIVLTVSFTIAVAGTVFAAGWQQDERGWKWQSSEGTFTANNWQWIDGNGDGLAECYYFDAHGYRLVNSSTPDGYFVDQNGMWTVDGQIQSQTLQTGTAGNETYGFNKKISNLAWDLMDHSQIENAAKYGDLVLVNGAWRYAESTLEAVYLIPSNMGEELRAQDKPYRIVADSRYISLASIFEDAPDITIYNTLDKIADRLEALGYEVTWGKFYNIQPYCEVTVDRFAIQFTAGPDNGILMKINQEPEKKSADYISNMVGSKTSGSSSK